MGHRRPHSGLRLCKLEILVALAHPQVFVNCTMPHTEAKHGTFRDRPDWSEEGGRLLAKRKAFAQLTGVYYQI